MDERLEKAFQTANYMTTLSGQRKIALEELQQHLIYYYNGASFTVSKELITFISTLNSLGNASTVILDDNSIPVKIDNVQEFLDNILAIFYEAMNAYYIKYTAIKSKRKIEDLITV